MINQKNPYQLFSDSLNLLAKSLACRTFLSSILSESVNNVLNIIDIEGIAINLVKSALLIKANIIIHNWDGFK
jgi:hypothetical protein